MDENNGKPLENEEKQTEVEKEIDEVQAKIAARKAKVKKEVREWIVALISAVLIVLVLQTFLFRIIRVDGHSMDDTLADGERLFVTVADVRFGSIERNSVVICHYPHRGLTYFVKRCVALPGDTVYCENGVTHVVYEQDGEQVDVALDERLGTVFLYGSPFDYEPYVLGDNEYFVVGDNRYNSHDSRDWNGPDVTDGDGNDGNASNNVGPISKGKIVGRVREVIWPLNSIRPVGLERVNEE